jgi:hypothetical protein
MMTPRKTRMAVNTSIAVAAGSYTLVRWLVSVWPQKIQYWSVASG